MGFFDIFKKKPQQKVEVAQPAEPKEILTEKHLAILERETKNFFPETGHWVSSCFSRSNEVSYTYLPCNLRNTDWLTVLMQENLQEKGIRIPFAAINKFIETSEVFNNERHNHELRIVKWQINWIMKGGENWLIPKGLPEHPMFAEGAEMDQLIRGGVVATLEAIGMDREVIEEGLEKNAEIWRPSCMRKGFNQLFEPYFHYGQPDQKPALELHRKNWIDMREYQYYQEHKESVDKYGILTPAMKMTKEEYEKLEAFVENLNNERMEYLKTWKIRKPKFTGNHYIQPEKLTQPSGDGEEKTL